jgi:hypothetical protein
MHMRLCVCVCMCVCMNTFVSESSVNIRGYKERDIILRRSFVSPLFFCSSFVSLPPILLLFTLVATMQTCFIFLSLSLSRALSFLSHTISLSHTHTHTLYFSPSLFFPRFHSRANVIPICRQNVDTRIGEKQNINMKSWRCCFLHNNFNL